MFQDPVQNKRIEEAVKEMSMATYNLLKTSEASSIVRNIKSFICKKYL